MNRKFFITFLFLILFANAISAQSQGEKLFKENKAKDASQVLENEILNGIVSANTYNFLGLAYYQLEDYEKSLRAFDRGIKAQPDNLKLLAFNKGNTLYAMKEYGKAAESYSESFNFDSTFYDALLNRANAFLMDNQLKNAKSDYELFLEKCPEDEQHEQIEAIIRALTEEIARREEEARLFAEQNKAKWEEIDPSFDDKRETDNIDWEKINPVIQDYSEENKKDWQKVETEIEENKEDNKKDWEKIVDEIEKDSDKKEDEKVSEELENQKEKQNWQQVEEKIEDNREENKKDWQKIVDEIEKNDDKKEEEKVSEDFENQKEKENWQKVDDKIEDNKNENKKDWQKIEEVITENGENKNTPWEKLDDENQDKLKNENREKYTDENEFVEEWENLDSDQDLNLKKLDEESKEAYKKWLNEQSLIKQKEAENELKKNQQKNEEERLSREKIVEDMIKAEEARRKKLLDDVTNSLNNNDSTNMTSGADDLIDYDKEGVLD